MAVLFSVFGDIILSIGRLDCGSHRFVAFSIASPMACPRRPQNIHFHDERVQAAVN
jgi:hypothetical protein